MEFENFFLNLEFLLILICSVVKFQFDSKNISNKYIFLSTSKNFLIKNTF